MLPLGLQLSSAKSPKKMIFELDKRTLDDHVSTFYKAIGVSYVKKRRQTKRTNANHTKKKR